MIFGTEVNDPYRWLEDDMAEDTKDWVRRQNVVTQQYLQQIPFRDAMVKRLTMLWNYEKYSAPFKEGGYTYFYKMMGCRTRPCCTGKWKTETLNYFSIPIGFQQTVQLLCRESSLQRMVRLLLIRSARVAATGTN